ncbi:MAG: enoyl-CoA hydratase/isomerase family protein [Actinobacteria bacterium]|nr:enoyl-CoA hydratase/isomerase family protein [Actinomycetota bacterium]
MGYDQLTTIEVTLERGVAWATVHHPPMNLWDRSFTADLVQLIGGIEADDGVRVLVLASADPDYFIAHADVEMIIDLPADAQGTPGEPAPVNLLLERLRTMPKVSIAAIGGIARGGGSEIALACDLRIASQSARLAQPEVVLGIIPGAGGTQRLTRLVGRARALEIVLGCGDVTGDEAAAIGYVNRVVADDELLPTVRRLAWRIAAMPPAVVAGAKAAVNAAEEDRDLGFAIEADQFRSSLGKEAHARMRRFLDLGGQTRDGEQDLTSIIDELNAQ